MSPRLTNSDVFIDDITHVLIVCTRSTATILGISRTEDKLNFFQTELSCQLPTRMLSVSGTNSGRIFMNGENKGLYELEYTNATGWWFGSSNKVWITGRLCVPSSFLPIRSKHSKLQQPQMMY
jgi:nuclear pore complex protein Nup155